MFYNNFITMEYAGIFVPVHPKSASLNKASRFDVACSADKPKNREQGS